MHTNQCLVTFQLDPIYSFTRYGTGKIDVFCHFNEAFSQIMLCFVVFRFLIP